MSFPKKKAPSGMTGGKIRKGTLYKAVNASTGRVVGVKGAKGRAWAAVASYARVIERKCVTCGDPTTEAGHYFHNSDKKNKQLGGNLLWYDIRNIHGQCGTCNRWKSGNLAKYTLFLEEKYGFGIVQELRDAFYTPKKWTMQELFDVENKYKALVDNVPQPTCK